MAERPAGRQLATATRSAPGGPAPLLSVRDLSVEFAGGTGGGRATRVVDRVSFDLRPGQVLGVVGESGSGKTVTMLSVMGLLPSTARVTSGEIRLDGTDLRGLSAAELRRRRGRDLGMIFQHPASSFNPLMTVGAQIVEGLRVHQPGLSRPEARDRTVELLRGVGVPDPAGCFTRYPHEYSGGMLQRSMIAMAMGNSPKLLIADEPTTALDVTIQAQVLELLASVRDETGTAIVVVTHNLGLVSAIADEVCVMYASRVVERGPVRQVLSAPTHPYTVALLESLPRMESHRRLVPIPGRMPSLHALPSGCSFHPRCWLSADRPRCSGETPALRPVAGTPDTAAAACHFAEEVPAGAAPGPGWAVDPLPDPGPPPGPGRAVEPLPDPGPPPGRADREPVLLATTDLRKHFPSRAPSQLFGTVLVRAVDGVDLALARGRSLALIGESGCGKSTLARTVVRLEQPSGGSVSFDGTDLTRLRGRRLRRIRPRMQLVFQDPASALDPRLTMWDTVAEPLRYHRAGSPAVVRARVAQLLEMVEIDPGTAHRRPHEYSGGQQQRVAIARALALSPDLLVLDEPLSALDVSVQAGIINMLNRVRSELGLSYLLISHDLSVVPHLCEELAVMYLGRVIERGPVRQVFRHPRHPYTRALLSAVPDPTTGPGERIVLVGEVPSPTAPPSGCRFRTRCWKAQAVCAEREPPLLPVATAGGPSVACHFPEPN